MENFKKEIIEAIQSLYYDSEDGCQAITCELADMEINGEGVHNCFACNLAISIRTLDDIANMLNDSEDDEQKVYRLFLPQIYLISEEILSLIENSGLEYKTIVQMFPLISRLRKLMNFLKHPKVRGFFQHPQYVFIKESSKLRTWKSSTEPEIFELLSEDNYLITDNLLNNYNFSFVKCEEKLYNEQDFQDRPDLVEKYLDPTESDVDTFIVIPNYLREGQEYTNATRYKLKLGEIVYFYFCEADIKNFIQENLVMNNLKS